MNCLYGNLFLEDACKKVRVTQKIALPNLFQGLFQGAVSYRPKIVLWVPNTLSCVMTVPYLQSVKVLIRYETLPGKKHAISVTSPLLIPVTQECFTLKIISLPLYHSLGL